jgi:hypothetical protein
MKNRCPAAFLLVLFLVGITGAAAVASASRHDMAIPMTSKSCMKFSGPVLMTYTNPQTIIIHIMKGKVNAATVFTMTPTTRYTRNGQPTTFADVKAGDGAIICAAEQLPSGTLLASWVAVTGP